MCRVGEKAIIRISNLSEVVPGMRKSIGILAIVMVVGASSAALAHNGWHRGYDGYGRDDSGRPCARFEQKGERFEKRKEELRKNMPQNIKDKITESRKIMIDMRSEMGKTPINRAKIMQLRDKNVKLRQEISDWFFSQKLDRIEKSQPQKK